MSAKKLDDGCGCLIALVVFICGIFFTAVSAQSYGEEKAIRMMQESAVKAGVGEYYIGENYERKFRWKSPAGTPAATHSP